MQVLSAPACTADKFRWQVGVHCLCTYVVCFQESGAAYNRIIEDLRQRGDNSIDVLLRADSMAGASLEVSADQLSVWVHSRKLYTAAAFAHTVQMALSPGHVGGSAERAATPPKAGTAQVCCA